MSETSFAYDVFISYSRHDETWVCADLLPFLESNGLRVCVDFRDFPVGDPSVKAMERAVLTLAYLAREWTTFESLLLQTLDPTNQQRRLLPLLKEKCALPPRIGMLTAVDFVAPRDWNFAWTRLLTAIKSDATPAHIPPPPPPPRDPAPPVKPLELSLRFTSDNDTAPIFVSLFRPDNGTLTNPAPFESPLDDKQLLDLRWYLEEFSVWHSEHEAQRAACIENDFERWGRALRDSVLRSNAAARLWQQFLDGGVGGTQVRAQCTAPLLTIDATDPRVLRLLWELFADDGGPVFARGVSVRRRLQQAIQVTPAQPFALPVRVLVVVARPDDAGFIDPRGVTIPLLNALDELGSQVAVEFLDPPTLAALDARLRVHVVHFDGHGVYDQTIGLGYLVGQWTVDSWAVDSGQLDSETVGQFLAQMENSGWRNLASAVRRVLNGERDFEKLRDALDFQDAYIVRAILTKDEGGSRKDEDSGPPSAGGGHAEQSGDSGQQQGITLDQLLGYVAAACQPNAPRGLAEQLHAFTRALHTDADQPAEARALGAVCSTKFSPANARRT